MNEDITCNYCGYEFNYKHVVEMVFSDGSNLYVCVKCRSLITATEAYSKLVLFIVVNPKPVAR